MRGYRSALVVIVQVVVMLELRMGSIPELVIEGGWLQRWIDKIALMLVVDKVLLMKVLQRLLLLMVELWMCLNLGRVQVEQVSGLLIARIWRVRCAILAGAILGLDIAVRFGRGALLLVWVWLLMLLLMLHRGVEVIHSVELAGWRFTTYRKT